MSSDTGAASSAVDRGAAGASANKAVKPAAWSRFPFLAFCWISVALVALAGLLLTYLVYPRLVALGDIPLYAFLAAAGGVLFILIGGLTLITVTSLTGIDLLYPHGKRSITVKYLFPIAVMLAKLIRFDRARLMASFVRVNNSLTIAQAKRIRGNRILVLLPHCLQIDVCNRKITTDLSNCIRCGKCPVGEFIEAGERYDLKIEVVNGGTLARKRVASWRPQGIIAVACERDLTLGIQDVHPVPVYGVINDRPHGPCVNTCVDMDNVDKAIKFFKGSGRG
ncbi:MAG: DUF116 domain-containing protein [Chitinispirillia bacterium]|nr:DUF116 domain-containing protein [Chitinispirillia bacterium]MCL2268239.1 DUF116 domain-containing protein [Chitinispirillia bacterium]